jgi:iron complex outermembrane receptor protein
LNYKNWDFNIFFRGAFGHQIVNTPRAFYESPTVTSVYNVVNTKYFTNSLKEPQQLFSSLFVEKGDFVKLDNATIGYSFKLKAGSGFKSIRAYATGQNLFMITGYTGVDPEVRWTDNGNVLAPGIDRRETWVMSRGFTFGLNVGL